MQVGFGLGTKLNRYLRERLDWHHYLHLFAYVCILIAPPTPLHPVSAIVILCWPLLHGPSLMSAPSGRCLWTLFFNSSWLNSHRQKCNAAPFNAISQKITPFRACITRANKVIESHLIFNYLEAGLRPLKHWRCLWNSLCSS